MEKLGKQHRFFRLVGVMDLVLVRDQGLHRRRVKLRPRRLDEDFRGFGRMRVDPFVGFQEGMKRL